VNLTAPNPVRNSELTKTLGRVLHRPAVLPVPKLGPSLLLGGELTESLLYFSQRVLPAKLQESGFSFTHPSLEGALRSMLVSRD
jgi:NAD dependent epimerase/dehydratase family enzyme